MEQKKKRKENWKSKEEMDLRAASCSLDAPDDLLPILQEHPNPKCEIQHLFLEQCLETHLLETSNFILFSEIFTAGQEIVGDPSDIVLRDMGPEALQMIHFQEKVDRFEFCIVLDLEGDDLVHDVHPSEQKGKEKGKTN